MKRIAIGCDPNASALKAVIIETLNELGCTVQDFGSDDPIYANVAFRVSETVAEKQFERGILLCGTGLGMCIAANKVPGVTAAVCSDVFSAERSVKSNNANVLTLGAQTIGVELAKSLVRIWIASEYEHGGRSEPKIQRIVEYENARRIPGGEAGV